ncbi:MAG: hypothetical protein LQ345_000852 [Seirophora villosa]|nr:MAG: hypothetical protein LQ345_000852 [Seirophora villosa]
MIIKDVPEKMLAAQVIEFNKPYKIHTIDTPTALSPYDLLLKTKVASLCHTDGMVSAGIMGTKLPCTASHEGCGEVVALGSSVADFRVGDRVMAGLPKHRCGHCADCLGPEELKHYCPNIKGHVGVTLDGAFAEYMVVDARESSRIPEGVSYETAAPLACAGTTIWGGLVRAGLKAGETVALVGAGGGLGHLGCQFAKAMGLQVVGIDARDEGLDLAKTSGAQIVIDARGGKEKVVEEVRKVTNGLGVDSALTISDAPDAAALACAITKMHGTMVQIAQPPDVSIPFAELIFRDVRVHGSLIAPRYEAQRMLDFVAENKITVKTNPFFGLQEIPNLVELAHSGKMAGKGVVIVDEDEIRKEKERRQVS